MSLRVLVGLALFLCALSACRGCEPEPVVPKETLEQVSEKVGFGTVTNLGPHRMEGSITRTVSDESGVISENDTHLIVVWQDWDNFEFKRLVDGEVVARALVVDARLWVRNAKGRMERQDDAEPYRMELRLLWNFWQEALGPFNGRLHLEAAEDGVVEGRSARRYQISLADAPEGAGATVTPLELTGVLWLDQATAVRLLADVQGRWRAGAEGGQIRQVTLHLVRTAIGEPQALVAPGRAHKARKAGAEAQGGDD